MGIDLVGLAALPALPEDTSGTSPGIYSVTPSVEHDELAAEGPDYVYKTWFQTPPLDPETIRRIQSVQLFAESHDQGFCDDPVAGTWTWFELAIMENMHANKPRVKDGVTLAWTSHKNHLAQEEFEWKTGIHFDTNHDMFRLLEDDNVIAVRLCARFGGWSISVQGGYLKIVIGEKVEREALEFGQVVSAVQTVQSIFQDVNSSLVEEGMQIAELPKSFFTANMMLGSDDRPLRVLSLDGGGVRGIASLMILDEVLKRTYPGKLPHEIFDLIGGTSTGGFIAVMLGLMKMSVAECIDAYKTFMKVVFPTKSTLGSWWQSGSSAVTGAKWDDAPLVKVIKDLIQKKLGDPEILLLNPLTMKSSCKVFLMAVNQLGANNHAPVTLRSYQHRLEPPVLPDMKLWEACRATSAAPHYFQPLTVGGISFLDGGLQANNPLGWLWNEVLTVFGPTRSTSCFLSIGTGTPKSETVAPPTALKLKAFAESMASIATNTEVTNILFRSLINAFAPLPNSKKYWRFNIGDGCPDWVPTEDGKDFQWVLREKREEQTLGELDDVAAMDNTIKATKLYIGQKGAQDMILECARQLSAV